MEEEFDIKDIYTPLSEAKKEIWRRWNDKELKKKVKEFLGGEIPKPFSKEPKAALSRSIITPNLEFFYFSDLSQAAGLKPIGMEGIEDKFCTKNYDKVSLGKLSFYEGIKSKIKNSNSAKSVVKIIDMVASDGKKFCDINTLWGEKLADFHHRMLDFHSPGIEIFDDFKWFSSRDRKNTSRQYYDNLFALFLCYGILFENFHANGKEESFTSDVIVESYKKIKDIFNLKPLIVPLVPTEDERCLYYWNSYAKK